MINRKKLTIALFICLSIIQLYVPVSMIVKHEITLRSGLQYKFRAAPVDPYDPFRGRYVTIRINDTALPVPDNVDFSTNQSIYVQLEQDEQGFAKMTGIAEKLPKEGAYVKAKILHLINEGAGKKTAVIKLPFDRYYMEEKLAPAAEKAYLEHARDNVGDAYVTVRILNGLAVIEKLYIKDMPMEEYLRKSM